MIGDYLTPRERFECIRVGARMQCGLMDAVLGPLPDAGVKAAETGAVKSAIAGEAKALTDAAISGLMFASLGIGAPLGVFTHRMARRIAGRRAKEEELREKIRIYRDAANELAEGVGGGS